VGRLAPGKGDYAVKQRGAFRSVLLAATGRRRVKIDQTVAEFIGLAALLRAGMDAYRGKGVVAGQEVTEDDLYPEYWPPGNAAVRSEVDEPYVAETLHYLLPCVDPNELSESEVFRLIGLLREVRRKRFRPRVARGVQKRWIKLHQRHKSTVDLLRARLYQARALDA
jgi:hypothetical protein